MARKEEEVIQASGRSDAWAWHMFVQMKLLYWFGIMYIIMCKWFSGADDTLTVYYTSKWRVYHTQPTVSVGGDMKLSCYGLFILCPSHHIHTVCHHVSYCLLDVWLGGPPGGLQLDWLSNTEEAHGCCPIWQLDKGKQCAVYSSQVAAARLGTTHCLSLRDAQHTRKHSEISVWSNNYTFLLYKLFLYKKIV